MSVPQSTDSAIEVVRPTPLPTPIRGPRLGLPTRDELEALMAYGQVIVKSGMAPAHIKTAEAAIVAMRYGHQLGIDEFTALQNMYVIGGKPSSMASLLHSLILRDHGGDAIQVVESTAERCVLRCKRRDSTHVTEVSYTFEEAKQAGVIERNAVWKQYPADLLFARCISRAGRQLFRDSTMGMYTPEEIGGSYVEVRGEVIDLGSGELPRDEQPASSNRLANLHRIGAERGLDHEALHRIAMLKRGSGLGGSNFTDTMLRDFERMIEQAADAELALWATDWAVAVREAERRGLDALQATGALMKSVGISRQSHPGLYAAYSAALERLKAGAARSTNDPIEADAAELPGMPADNARYDG